VREMAAEPAAVPQPTHPSWTPTRLGDLCEFVRGVTFDKGEASSDPRDGCLPILRAGNISEGLDLDNDLVWVPAERVSPQQHLRVGDIAICMSSGSPAVVGKSAALQQRFAGSVGAFCGIIRARDSRWSEYIAFWLRSPVFMGWRDGQARGANIQNLRFSQFESLAILTPPVDERDAFVSRLRSQLEAAARMRAAAHGLTHLLDDMIDANLRRSLAGSGVREVQLAEYLVEVKKGVGVRWREYPVLGVTRRGVASAKESVGKFPERYKLLDSGTVFYNPMRILLGSIGMVDAEDAVGITSPDYVVVKGIEGKLHHRWFYWWLRSWRGAEFIKSLTRGAVRERMLFRRLTSGSVRLPSWESQVEAAVTMLRIAEARRQVAAQSPSIDALPTAFLRRAFGGAG